MLKELLYLIMEYISKAHDWLLQLNNQFEFALSDKELHFLVIGIIGMLIFFFVNPIFTALARRGKQGVISWIYTFTVIIVLTFAIEIGQHITGTGNMEFADIVFGIVGFLFLHLIYSAFAWIIRFIIRTLKRK